MRGWRNTVELMLFEISNSMKPYPSVSQACTSKPRPVIGFSEPNQFDEASNIWRKRACTRLSHHNCSLIHRPPNGDPKKGGQLCSIAASVSVEYLYIRLFLRDIIFTEGMTTQKPQILDR